jgi:hypothetical protein
MQAPKFLIVTDKSDEIKPNFYINTIFSFSSINSALKFLEYDLDNLNKFLNDENFKYGIEIENDSEYKLHNIHKSDIIIKVKDLSPGEQFILLF